jgi:ribonuclease-3
MNNFKCKLDELFKELNLSYNNIDLYYEAFSHPSYANEMGTNKHYERLEYLGDAILDFLVGEYLFKTRPDMAEGQMTKLRAEYVCESANEQYSNSMNLGKLILFGVGAKKENLKIKKSVLGNVFESFLGALYLDHNMDYVRNVLEKWVFPRIGNMKVQFFVDYKTKLQETMQAERTQSPTYLIVNETGPAHDKTFEALVKVDDIKLGRGIGKTKKDAEQEAAKDALEKLAKI